MKAMLNRLLGGTLGLAMSVSLLPLVMPADVAAKPAVRSAGRTSVNHSAERARPAAPPANRTHAGNRPQGTAANRQTHVDRNAQRTNISGNNVNIDRSRDVNVDVHGGGGCCYHDWDDDWDDHWHPVATAAVVATTAAVVGSIVRSIPPNCSTVVIDGISYSQCGSTWYQPQYVGSSVQYVVVNPPR